MKKNLFIISIITVSIIGSSDSYLAQEVFEEPSIYEDRGKRDPFWPLVTDTGTIINYEKDFLPADLILEGIVLGENGNNLAIINGEVVDQDGSIGEFIILEIRTDSVLLTKDQQTFELKLK